MRLFVWETKEPLPIIGTQRNLPSFLILSHPHSYLEMHGVQQDSLLKAKSCEDMQMDPQLFWL